MMKLLLLAPLLICGQAEKIEGIGKLKIGVTTTAIIPELAKELRVRMETKDNVMGTNYYKAGKRLFQLLPNKQNDKYNSPPHTTFCQDSKVFYLSEYTVSGIKLTEIFLTFYLDKLTSIRCGRSDELEEVLRLKYGPSEQKIFAEQVKCRNATTGIESTTEIKDIRSYWQNGDITMALVETEIQMGDCRIGANKYLIVGLPKAEAQIHECDDKARESQAVEKKKTLKDF